MKKESFAGKDMQQLIDIIVVVSEGIVSGVLDFCERSLRNFLFFILYYMQDILFCIS